MLYVSLKSSPAGGGGEQVINATWMSRMSSYIELYNTVDQPHRIILQPMQCLPGLKKPVYCIQVACNV